MQSRFTLFACWLPGLLAIFASIYLGKAWNLNHATIILSIVFYALFGIPSAMIIGPKIVSFIKWRPGWPRA